MSPDEIQSLLEQLQNIVSNGFNLNMLSYVVIFVLTAAGGFFGAYLRKSGEYLATKKKFDEILEQISETTKTTKRIEENIQQQFEFIESQLKEFYSPLVSCRIKIKALNQIRCEIYEKSNETWNRFSKRFEYQTDSEIPTSRIIEEGRAIKEAQKPYEAITDYEKDQFEKIILPLYDEMLEIFTNNFWLAEDSTKKHYFMFCRFVEVWHRYHSKSIPMEVLKELHLTEEDLHDFYDEIERQLNELTNKINKAE